MLVVSHNLFVIFCFFQVKPGNTHTADDTSMSQTAKRILATLEQFSTPILDAKRIPVAQEPVLSSLGSRKRSRVDDVPQVLEQPRIPKRLSNKPMVCFIGLWHLLVS